MRGMPKGGNIMYFVYILKSLKNNRQYIGHTSNISERLSAHNRGSNRSTKNGRPWKLIYTETYDEKIIAARREREIKSYKGGDAFKNLLNNTI